MGRDHAIFDAVNLRDCIIVAEKIPLGLFFICRNAVAYPYFLSQLTTIIYATLQHNRAESITPQTRENARDKNGVRKQKFKNIVDCSKKR